MTIEKYLEDKLWFYLEHIEEIEDLKDKLDILLKVKQIGLLQNISDELSYIHTRIEDIDMQLAKKL
jgi:hypothetical protein